MERATRYSRKREAILNAIQSTDCHPSAEWVYQTLKPTHPDLSLGTVYRNLVLFQQQGPDPEHRRRQGTGAVRRVHCPPQSPYLHLLRRCDGSAPSHAG